jgi:hypothetical protein
MAKIIFAIAIKKFEKSTKPNSKFKNEKRRN